MNNKKKMREKRMATATTTITKIRIKNKMI